MALVPACASGMIRQCGSRAIAWAQRRNASNSATHGAGLMEFDREDRPHRPSVNAA